MLLEFLLLVSSGLTICWSITTFNGLRRSYRKGPESKLSINCVESSLLNSPVKWIRSDNHYLWNFSFETNTQMKMITIGCRKYNKEEWDRFFDKSCKRWFNHQRHTTTFKAIRNDYYRFIELCEKEGITFK